MRSPWRLAALAISLLSLAACSTTGLYQARTGESGYAETQLGTEHWRVEFVGDDFTARETVETYLLYRAAELTNQNGHQWFAMAAPAVSEDVEIIVEAERPQAYRDLYWRPHWRRRSRFFWSDIDPVGPMPHEMRRREEASVSARVHYSASAEIFMGDGPLPTGAFNAEQTVARLQPSIVRPET
jgi:hypothetical protein